MQLGFGCWLYQRRGFSRDVYCARLFHLAGEVLAAYRCPRWSNLHYFGSGDGLRGHCPSALVGSIRLMIFTTTNNVEGREIDTYIRIIAGETVAGINFLKDIGASFRSITGGRSAGYEEEAVRARESALNELWNRGQEVGADAVVGIAFDYSPMGTSNDMLMVTATGTAVRLKPLQ